MKGCCECCLRHADVEPAMHHISGRHIYVCADPECRRLHSAKYTLIDWQKQWRDYYEALETRRQQQEATRKTFGQVA